MYRYVVVLDSYFCMIADSFVNHNADFVMWYLVLDIFGPDDNFCCKIYLMVHFVYCKIAVCFYPLPLVFVLFDVCEFTLLSSFCTVSFNDWIMNFFSLSSFFSSLWLWFVDAMQFVTGSSGFKWSCSIFLSATLR